MNKPASCIAIVIACTAVPKVINDGWDGWIRFCGGVAVQHETRSESVTKCRVAPSWYHGT